MDEDVEKLKEYFSSNKKNGREFLNYSMDRSLMFKRDVVVRRQEYISDLEEKAGKYGFPKEFIGNLCRVMLGLDFSEAFGFTDKLHDEYEDAYERCVESVKLSEEAKKAEEELNELLDEIFKLMDDKE
ncbi:MAG: hypothetical protein ACXACX_09330 [Candidatus Hodarchaeales archaeon]|jgi:hypothetical protein